MSWLEFWKDLDRRAVEHRKDREAGRVKPQRKNSPDRMRTLRAEERIARGFHPFGLRLREPRGETCGSCAHLRVKSYAGTYFKCDLRGDSNGPGTDCRKKWPACERWEAGK